MVAADQQGDHALCKQLHDELGDELEKCDTKGVRNGLIDGC
jgi:hypothetical protein